MLILIGIPFSFHVPGVYHQSVAKTWEGNENGPVSEVFGFC